MLAHFDPVKRHWLFFDALRRLPRRYRVLLMGVPLGKHTEAKFWAEARAFGVQDRFELHVRPTRAEVMAGLARGRVSLVFSRQEGSCIAVSESLFADTPVGIFRNARIGSRASSTTRRGYCSPPQAGQPPPVLRGKRRRLPAASGRWPTSPATSAAGSSTATCTGRRSRRAGATRDVLPFARDWCRLI